MKSLLKIEELLLFGLALYVFGYLFSVPGLMFAGTVLLGHSSRVFGYGLKHADAFENTHLGMIGKAN